MITASCGGENRSSPRERDTLVSASKREREKERKKKSSRAERVTFNKEHKILFGSLINESFSMLDANEYESAIERDGACNFRVADRHPCLTSRGGTQSVIWKLPIYTSARHSDDPRAIDPPRTMPALPSVADYALETGLG